MPIRVKGGLICFSSLNLKSKIETKTYFSLFLGYADSSPITPSKTGVVQDALKVYEYAKSLAKETPIIVYGHSLGTAVSTEAVAQLCEQGDPPKALILG